MDGSRTVWELPASFRTNSVTEYAAEAQRVNKILVHMYSSAGGRTPARTAALAALSSTAALNMIVVPIVERRFGRPGSGARDVSFGAPHCVAMSRANLVRI